MAMSEILMLFNFPPFEFKGPLMYFFKHCVWDGDNCQTFAVVVKLRFLADSQQKTL